jgi:hypothetical protein
MRRVVTAAYANFPSLGSSSNACEAGEKTIQAEAICANRTYKRHTYFGSFESTRERLSDPDTPATIDGSIAVVH